MVQWSTDNRIDDRHTELHSRLDKLVRAMGLGEQEVRNMIKFLEDYVVEHFQAEEHLMFDNQYPSYSSHKIEHTGFIKSLDTLKARMLHGGEGISSVILVHNKALDWLNNHTSTSDKKFGDWLNSDMKMAA